MDVRHVVVGYDGSAGSEIALAWAAERARRRSAPLVLVHALRPWPYEAALLTSPEADEARALLDRVVQRLAQDGPLDVRPRLSLAASPARLVLDHAGDAECVVVGARGHGGPLGGLHLGSVGAQLVSHAPCPVVVVRRGSGSGIVVGVDGSPTSSLAIGFAFAEAEALGEPLTAVHAWRPRMHGDLPLVDDMDDGHESALLSESLAGWSQKSPDVEVRHVLSTLEPAAALVAESATARLLVVGSRGLGGFRGLLLGSVSGSVLRHAVCDVAVVRAEKH
jgi:nucleotide-binding universal stress UspA family protein